MTSLDVAPHLQRMRDAAESLMVDIVTIREKTGTTQNTTTGALDDTYVQVYSGKARIQQQVDFPTVEQGGSRTVTTLRLSLQLPITVTGLKVDHQVTVDTCVHDTDLPGRIFRVASLHHKTHATARRVMIEEVVT